jgi:DNA-binding response OmpR family regulator
MLPDYQNISVLVIDDEQMILDSLVNYLDDVGFRTSGCSEPDAALQIIRANPPDVCLIDLRMPGIDGEQIITEILTTVPGVRCLIYTGALYHISENLIRLGVSQDDVIKKPVQDFELLCKKISGVCGN